jgi:hypothetical protein
MRRLQAMRPVVGELAVASYALRGMRPAR